MQARDYQTDLKNQIYTAWQEGHKNVMAVLPTGGGKTFVFSDIVHANTGIDFTIAHRQELLSQICMSLAQWGVRHRIIGNSELIRWIVQLQMEEFGRSYYDGNSNHYVVGIDTLIRRYDQMKKILERVNLFNIDEGHHVLVTNKWGKGVAMFPNAYGLLVTATPGRADRKGLGRHAHGVVDKLVFGPSQRELINRNFLCDYRIFAPKSDIDLSKVEISSTTGDFNAVQLRQAVKRSHIVGDVVAHYLRIAKGLQGITFATDIETATDITNQFNRNGVKAEIVTSKTKDKQRVEIIKRFRQKKITQLVNVDLFGEGFDVPGIEVVSMARPTESFNLYCQQFGRGLRILEGKKYAFIIDHVNNVVRHGLPDAPRVWSLDGPPPSSRKQKTPIAICGNCLAAYEVYLKLCPFCLMAPARADRTKPEFVDGDLIELDPAVLREMRKEIERVDAPAYLVREKLAHAHAPVGAQIGAERNHMERQHSQAILRGAIALWSGYQRAAHRSDSEIYKRFYYEFNIDVMSAQVLGSRDARQLAEVIYLSIYSIQERLAA